MADPDPLFQRHVLTGLVACQLGFIRRDRLDSILSDSDSATQRQSWSQGLPEIEANDVDFINRIVFRYLENHEGNLSRCLEKLSSVGSLAMNLSTMERPADEATISLLEAQPPDDTLVVAVNSTGSSFGRLSAGGRYEILRSYAQGGLGEVSVARDRELNREVAIKEIKRRFCDDRSSRARFMLEAEVTGRLEHPGIVPVYSLGCYDDGRPFYAMRFIQGSSLKDAIDRFHRPPPQDHPNSGVDESTFEFRQLLNRFVDVCNAIEFAHQHGVLHRDLKPDNVMLGDYGETLVVDWGLAKLTRSATDPASDHHSASDDPMLSDMQTIAGSIVGTPAYMSPEQASGDVEQIGPASDVFSLGATLYYLLTGRAAYTGMSGREIVTHAQTGVFPTPSSVRPKLPRALAAICLKAMSQRPEDRYAAPREIADEIERFLADEPVQAYPEPIVLRAKRAVKKHQTLAASGAATLAASAIGLGILVSVVNAKNTELSRLNKSVSTKNSELTESLQRESAAKLAADKNAETARQQGQLALGTLATVISDVQGGLRELSGASEIRRNILRTALEKLKGLTPEFVPESDVNAEVLLALRELGDLAMEFANSEPSEMLPDQIGISAGSPSAEESAAIQAALAFYEHALHLAEQVANERPADSDAQVQRAISHVRVGEARQKTGDLEGAKADFTTGFDLLQAHLVDNPDDIEAMFTLTHVQLALGHVAMLEGDLPLAVNHYTDAVEKRRVFAEVLSDDAESQRRMCVAQLRLASTLVQLGRISQAEELLWACIEKSEELVAENPAHVSSRELLAYANAEMGALLRRTATFEEAIGFSQRALTLREELAKEDPSNLRSQANVANSLYDLGWTCLEAGRNSETIDLLQRALAIHESFSEVNQGNVGHLLSIASLHDGLGLAYRRTGDFQEALEHHRAALALWEQLVALEPTNVYRIIDLADNHLGMGDFMLEAGRIGDALSHYRTALQYHEDAAEIDPENQGVQRDLQVDHYKIGAICLLTERLDEADAALESARGIALKLVETSPSAAMDRRDLAGILGTLGSLRLKQGRLEEAKLESEKALAIIQAAVEADPGNFEFQRDLAITYVHLAEIMSAKKLFPEAVAYFRKAVSLDEARARNNPTDFQATTDLLSRKHDLGEALLNVDDVTGAVQAFGEAQRAATELSNVIPDSAALRQTVLVSARSLAIILLRERRLEEGLLQLQIGRQTAQAMIDAGQMTKFAQANLREFERRISIVEELLEILGDWDRLLAQPADELPDKLKFRADRFVERGRFAEAAQAAHKLSILDKVNATQVFEAACVLGFCASSMATEPDELTAEQLEQRGTWIKQCLAALKRAVDLGAEDVGAWAERPELRVLHDLEAFQDLVGGAEK